MTGHMCGCFPTFVSYISVGGSPSVLLTSDEDHERPHENMLNSGLLRALMRLLMLERGRSKDCRARSLSVRSLTSRVDGECNLVVGNMRRGQFTSTSIRVGTTFGMGVSTFGGGLERVNFCASVDSTYVLRGVEPHCGLSRW